MAMIENHEFPSVSIVVVNLNGRHHLRACLNSLLGLRYPKEQIEIVLVDNASSDGSVEFVRQKYPMVKVICNDHNEGFAKPSNDGARAASGEYVAFLNNDMRVERDWLIELLHSLRANDAACVGSVILNWNGELLDFAGGGISFAGFGLQSDFHAPMKEMEPKLGEDRELLFACGGAMLMKRALFLSCGAFDEDFFAYYEDVDLGWRLNVLGHKVVLSVKSRVRHRHSGTSRSIPKERVKYLMERNKFYACYKNYGDERLYRVFFPSVLLHVRQAYISGDIDEYNFNIQNTRGFDSRRAEMKVGGVMRLCALNEFVENIGRFTQKRKAVQAARKLEDQNLNRFFPDPFVVYSSDTPDYLNSENELVHIFGIDQLFEREYKEKVLLISNDHVGKKMAGTGIRYWELAKSLEDTGKFQVALAVPNDCDMTYKNIQIVPYSPQNTDRLLQAAKESSIVMLMGFVLEVVPALRKIVERKYVIIDIYDPFVIEGLELNKEEERSFKEDRHKEATSSLDYQLRLGDFFVCADSKQQDYWIGMLAALNRINPRIYDADRSGAKLIDVVPFGISDQAPVHTHQVLKGVWPGIGADDFVLIWGGGVWNWFDPITLIKAVGLLAEAHPRIKLFFLGVKHPNPAVSQMRMLNEAVELSKQMGLYDKSVFFNFGWVDYAERQNYLTEADIGVSCHFETLETRFSFRTRILDYLWASLPIVCTKGDYFAGLVEKEQLGLTVDFQNERQLADAILRLAQDKEFYGACRQNIPAVADCYRWSAVTRPVVDYCSNPTHFRTQEMLSNRIETDIVEEDEEEDESEELLPRQEKIRPFSGSHTGSSVRSLLYQMERQQADMQRSLSRIERRSRFASTRLTELQEWSYMMNDRFNKFKGLANPVRFLKRLFRRRR